MFRRQPLSCPSRMCSTVYSLKTPALFFRLMAKKSGRQDTNRTLCRCVQRHVRDNSRHTRSLAAIIVVSFSYGGSARCFTQSLILDGGQNSQLFSFIRLATSSSLSFLILAAIRLSARCVCFVAMPLPIRSSFNLPSTISRYVPHVNSFVPSGRCFVFGLL